MKFTILNKDRLKKKKSQKGFTVLELLVTVAIIGVLATIANVSYTKYKLNALKASSSTWVAQKYTRQRVYFNENKKFAGASDDLRGPTPSVLDYIRARREINKYIFDGNVVHGGHNGRYILPKGSLPFSHSVFFNSLPAHGGVFWSESTSSHPPTFWRGRILKKRFVMTVTTCLDKNKRGVSTCEGSGAVIDDRKELVACSGILKSCSPWSSGCGNKSKYCQKNWGLQ